MLEQMTRRWLNDRGLPMRGPQVSYSIAAAFELFMEQYGPSRSAKSQRDYRMAFKAVMLHGDPSRSISETHNNGGVVVSALEWPLKRLIHTKQGVNGTIGPQTMLNYSRTFMVFCNWCHSEGIMPVVPRMRKLRRGIPAIPGKPIKVYEDWEVQAMISMGRKSTREAFRRMADLIDLLWRTPLRLHEALVMRLKDVNVATKTLVVERKDGRTLEYVPLRFEDIELLRDIAKRTGAHDPESALLGYQATSDSRLRRTFYDLMNESGVDRQGRSFHEFKKSYITRLVRRVGKDLSLQEVARLSRCGIQVLERHYLKMTPDHIREKLELIHTYQEASGHPSQK